jgi:hypothetical protein
MRKYLAAAAVGAMLIGTQAAASDSAVVNSDDRLGADSAVSNDDMGLGPNMPLVLLAGGLFIALVAYGFSQNGGGNPTSP